MIIQNVESNEQLDWMARSMNNTITEIRFKMMVIKQ
jgi:hypothetical protein